MHRLDRDTSGVMVVAKTEQALASLSAAFAARDIERAYRGVGVGDTGAVGWGDRGGDWAGSAGSETDGAGEQGGKAALTHYATVSVFHAAVSLLECHLATGRTHQIRVHLSSQGHPVVGDPVYLRRIPAASRGVPEPVRVACLDFPRQALHAATLGFRHPATGAQLRFETPLPADFQSLMNTLAGP